MLQEVAAPFGEYWASVRRRARGGWEARASAPQVRLRAVIGHALEFGTWRSLARTQRLGDVEAAELMVRLARV